MKVQSLSMVLTALSFAVCALTACQAPQPPADDAPASAPTTATLVAQTASAAVTPAAGQELMTSDKLTTDEIQRHLGEPGVAKLMWGTESEKDNFGFNIMRARTPDGDFLTVNEKIILGAGNSSTRNNYIFYDLNVKVGETCYYRIDEINFNGDVRPISPVLPFTVNRLYLGGTPPANANKPSSATLEMLSRQ